ncbi:probable Ribosome assembly protein 1 [Saccharomycodes ludwigii]|uniref:Ribosome assembly protein 1 n=1 Tax=Saccharomycodes ludwigii TaxID=36035 RepID=A0A376B6K8_9ASCO|nr:hypothetical protein SCDLUD_002948 [Saccharomycodes ludwigii]KAH3901453.1 hypothetical protein SCDLUD_002948 [Saccharomycodes ludwigii]SSD60271.1 probable Ribosome assembly protein 1 [Saccharomycodes ludwigii]
MGRLLSPETCAKLQANPKNIRNICILAHVDHGKTSLSDSLLASNGIISTKLAGKVRYLDSRPDEQSRGITMESSAISLYFRVLKKLNNKEEEEEGDTNVQVNEHLINLIDSPGHIDFSSEVSAASRLCDGAVVLVDVVEGVCSQTVIVLRQCWTEKLKPILVLNKIDRLITELKLSPEETYFHLTKVIEQVNSVIGSFFAGDLALDDLSWREQIEAGNIDTQFVEKDDSDLYFHPEKNNVIFASAIDGWGFNIDQIAKFYEKKLGMNRNKLNQVLWGDYYLDSKTKKIIEKKALKGKNLKPLFVSFILDNIWKVYGCVLGDATEQGDHQLDIAGIEKITKVLDVKLTPRDLRSKDHKALLKTIMGQWLPVSTAVLLTCIEKVPSPVDSQAEKIESILSVTPNADLIDVDLKSAMERCDCKGPVSAYVSKMLSIPREELPIKNEVNEAPTNQLAQLARTARLEALKVAKAAERAEILAKLNAQNEDGKKKTQNRKNEKNKDVQESYDDGDALYSRAKDTVTTPNIDGMERLKKKSKVINVNDTSNITNTDEFKIVSAPAPEFHLDFEYEKDSNEYGSDDNEDSYVDDTTGLDVNNYVPPPIDPNDPLSSLFEYEEEEPMDYQAEEEESLEEVSNEVLVGFARIYSGTLKIGQEISILEPKYDPSTPDKHIKSAVITDLYLFMGKDLISLNEVPAGNIVGIAGLDHKILKNGTLIEPGIKGVNLAGSTFHSRPIVRVALESADPTQMNKLVRGLELLNQADPCVETYVEDNGEHILCTAGELHLERCLNDLEERFAGIEITRSDPVIPYMETYISTTDMNPPRNSEAGRGFVQFNLGEYKLTLHTMPLARELTQFLINNQESIKQMNKHKKIDIKFKENISKLLPKPLNVSNITSFGGKRCGPNILFSSNNVLRNYFEFVSKDKFAYADSIINGFQLACNEGPLCKEEVQGMAIIVDDVYKMTEEEIAALCVPNYQIVVPNLSGRFMTCTRDAIHESFLDWSPRIMLAIYSCAIQAPVEVLGKVYAVVQKRHGRIVSEEMKEGTPFFEIIARIPVVEAFGFSDDIRKRTSGAAQPQLVFSGFESIDLDPFWVPTTEEELEKLGEFADKENIARKHMNAIRKRKGLFVDEKVVKNAEKQRTLKKD